METKYLTIKRVLYSNNTTPKKDREYRIFPQGGPVGTISEWSNYAKDSGYNGLKIIEKDELIEYQEL